MIFSFTGLETAKVNLKTAQITLGGKSSEKAHFSKNITGEGIAPPFLPGGYATNYMQTL
jgi:hypothetical protein